MEKYGDEDIVASAMSVLRKIYPTAPNPTRTFVTRWNKDIYAKGSYSYMAPHSSGDDYDVMAKPVIDNDDGKAYLYFAGEATLKFHPNTMTGAFMSGIREAVNIAKARAKAS